MARSLDIVAVLAASVPPLYDFLFDLVVDPRCAGIENGCDARCWAEEFLFNRNQLDALALEWASDEDLAWPDRVTLLLNLDKLPWHNDHVKFHWPETMESDDPPT